MKRILKISAVILILLLTSFTIVYYKFPGTVIKGSLAMARMSAGLTESSIEAAEHRWPYLAGGSGEAMVLLHGFGMNKDLMVPVAAQLTDRYRVIIPDLPAFGKNKEIAGKDYCIDRQSKRLNQFLTALQVKQIHLIGVSMGGGIASWFTSEYSDKVKSLTIIGSMGTNPGNKSAAIEDYKKDNSRTLCIKTRKDMDRVFKLAYKYPRPMPEHFKEYLLPIFASYHQSHTRIIVKMVKKNLTCLEPRLRMIQAPTLILWGSEDRIFPVQCARTFHRGIKKSRLVVIKDCGHITFADQPKKTFAAMNDFLVHL